MDIYHNGPASTYCVLTSHSFSAQPLCILGVTGPFSVLAENVYELCEHHFNVRDPP